MTTVYVAVKHQRPREPPVNGAAKARANAEAEQEQGPNETSLDVENLRRGVSLFARVGDLVERDEDAEAVVERLKQTIEGDDAQAQFKARLQEVYGILERTLSSTDADEPEPPGEDAPPRAQRVLRPLEKAARACAGRARRVAGSARRAIRSRREAKAARRQPSLMVADQ